MRRSSLPASTARTVAELDRLTPRAAPGLQYVAVTDETVLIEHAGGWAHLTDHRAMTARTTMMAYSMTKTITAVAVLQLVEEGRLSLDAPLGDAMPYGGDITVRQLLAHTAGLPTPLPLRWVHAFADHDTFDERAALQSIVHTHPRPTSAPGLRYRYSNLGYWWLGRLIEESSRKRFQDYVRERIIVPLGLSSAEMGFVATASSDHAAGYLERYSVFNLLKRWMIDPQLVGETIGRWVHIRDHYVNGPAFGGLVGTARAFARFLQDQLADRSVLLGTSMRSLLGSEQAAGNGRPIPMGLGWHVGRHGSQPVLFKEGGGGGFHCLMRLYPSHWIGTVLMTNATGLNVQRCMDRLDAPFIGG